MDVSLNEKQLFQRWYKYCCSDLLKLFERISRESFCFSFIFNLFETQKNEITNSPIHRLTNLKCCEMSFKVFKMKKQRRKILRKKILKKKFWDFFFQNLFFKNFFLRIFFSWITNPWHGGVFKVHGKFRLQGFEKRCGGS